MSKAWSAWQSVTVTEKHMKKAYSICFTLSRSRVQECSFRAWRSIVQSRKKKRSGTHAAVGIFMQCTATKVFSNLHSYFFPFTAVNSCTQLSMGLISERDYEILMQIALCFGWQIKAQVILAAPVEIRGIKHVTVPIHYGKIELLCATFVTCGGIEVYAFISCAYTGTRFHIQPKFIRSPYIAGCVLSDDSLLSSHPIKHQLPYSSKVWYSKSQQCRPEV